MIRANENARAANTGAGQIKSDYSTRIFPYLRESIKAFENRAWVLSYSIEESRQRYADRRQFLRQAAACLILALLRLCGWRYV